MDFAFHRNVLGVSITAGLLAGCGALPLSLSKGQDDTQPPIAARFASGASYAQTSHKTFHYTGKEQWFKVPKGVLGLTVTALGAAGGGPKGGHGGRLVASLAVAPGEKLAVFVGGAGTESAGGFNGGASGGSTYGGGGASDVREHGDSLDDRVLVVGGGGGEGDSPGGYHKGYGNGGKAGYNAGESGADGWCDYHGGCNSGIDAGGGGGATQYKGGSGGHGGGGSRGNGDPGKNGKLGSGGTGGIGCPHSSGQCSYGGGGGGGGGGYYGGGGGGCGGGDASGYDGGGGGGGGGSGFILGSAKIHQSERASKAANGNGLVIISW
jgi:hypothetical protein